MNMKIIIEKMEMMELCSIKFKATDFIIKTDKLIKEKGFTTRELEKRSGLSRGVISEVLNGYYGPFENHLHGLAKALDVKVEDLLTR